MKKFSIVASALLFGSMLNADIPIKTGWQLLGATEDINTTIFNSTCINYMWKYDTTNVSNPAWRVHIANGANYTHSFGTMATVAKGEGYWVFGNAECVVQTPSSSSVSWSSSSSTYVPPTTSSSSSSGADLPVFGQSSLSSFSSSSIGIITSEVTGRVWMDRNLGASQVCTDLNDTNCYGDYYQWGRGADGHEKANSVTTSTISSTTLPTHGNFITSSDNYNYDWTIADNNGTSRSANWNVCPAGYRIPTKDELEAEHITDATDAFNKLKLPSAGHRRGNDGSMEYQGYGVVWSSSVNGSNSVSLAFISGGANAFSLDRARGMSVRCIEDRLPSFGY